VTVSVVPPVPLKKCLGEFDEYFDISMSLAFAATLSIMYKPLLMSSLAPVIFRMSPSLRIWPNLVLATGCPKKRSEDNVILALRMVSDKS
jgi:hypothetical protein